MCLLQGGRIIGLKILWPCAAPGELTTEAVFLILVGLDPERYWDNQMVVTRYPLIQYTTPFLHNIRDGPTACHTPSNTYNRAQLQHLNARQV